jgi:hypothetical protein
MARAAITSWLWTLPALAVGCFDAGLWLGVAPTNMTLVGWTLLMTVAGTAAAVLAGTGAVPEGRRGIRGVAAVAATTVLILICVVWNGAGLGEAVRGGAVAGSWVLLWGLAARAWRRWGAGVSAAAALGLAGLGLAAPVAAVPLVRWAGHWGSTGGAVSAWQGRVVEVLAHACPFFPLLSALKPALRLDWGTLPGMYAWSGLGQEVPLELPGAWGCAALYAALATAVWAAGRRSVG